MTRNLLTYALSSALVLPAFGQVFDFTGSASADAASKQFTAGSLTVTVTGGGTSTTNSNITDTADGLGVIGVGGNPLAGDDFNSELNSAVNQGPIYANFIDLTFSEQVTIAGLTLSLFDGDDDYGLTVDGAELAGPNVLTDANLDATGLGTGAERTGTTFRITTESSGGINLPSSIETDSFRLASVTVVPEPTSLALLGLGGLLVARRRR